MSSAKQTLYKIISHFILMVKRRLRYILKFYMSQTVGLIFTPIDWLFLIYINQFRIAARALHSLLKLRLRFAHWETIVHSIAITIKLGLNCPMLHIKECIFFFSFLFFFSFFRALISKLLIFRYGSSSLVEYIASNVRSLYLSGYFSHAKVTSYA